tara:strand:+ start:7166 stop:7375 length:210 start_codon:yes stop_codon:yes gene_type:complete
MGRYTKICQLAEEKNVPVREILVRHIIPLDIRIDIAIRINAADDDDLDSEDLFQLCDTPTSQKKLLSFF